MQHFLTLLKRPKAETAEVMSLKAKVTSISVLKEQRNKITHKGIFVISINQCIT